MALPSGPSLRPSYALAASLSACAVACAELVAQRVDPTVGSALAPLLSAPVVLAVLACRFRTTLLIGLALAVVSLGPMAPGSAEARVKRWIRAVVIVGIAVGGGLFTRRIRIRQEGLTARLERSDDLLDLTIWIGTCTSLEDAAEVAVTGLTSLLRVSATAIYARQSDDSDYELLAARQGGVAARGFPAALPDATYSKPLFARATSAADHGLAGFIPPAGSFALIGLGERGDTAAALLFAAFADATATTPDGKEALEAVARQIALPLLRTRTHERLHDMAYTDALTGLHNYRAFRSHVRDEVKRSTRYGHPLSLLLVDVDRFKQVNDRCGHEEGDRALARIATILASSVRDTDITARYGGDEFAILCPESGAAEAMAIAERIRAAVEACRVSEPDAAVTSVSIGVACCPSDAIDEAALVRTADLALYDAKRAGRNRAAHCGHAVPSA